MLMMRDEPFLVFAMIPKFQGALRPIERETLKLYYPFMGNSEMGH